MGIQFNVNLQGLTPVDPFVDLPTGVYPAKVLGFAENDKEGKKSIRVDVSVEAGPYAGAPQQLWLGMDFSKDMNRRNWLTFLLSIGAPANLLNGTVAVDTDKYIGKSGFIYVQAAPAGSDDYANRSFIRKEVYERMKGMNTAAQAPAGAQATGAQTPANGAAGFTPVTPQPGGAQNTANVAAALNF